jgi:hypothetical protein
VEASCRGNHDGLIACGDPAASASKQLSAALLQHYFRADQYSAHNVGPGWKVVALHSMLGESGCTGPARWC